MGHTVPPLKDASLLIQKCFINGEFVDAASGATFEVHDPATGKLVGTCPECDVGDTERAVAAADAAFKTFRRTTARHRSRLLRRWYDLLVDNAEDIATLIAWESGKPLADARAEAAYAASFLEWFSEEAPRVYGDTFPTSGSGQRAVTLKQPVGVCSLVTPWNFPAAMVTRKAGPALAAGCAVVVKSPGETPFTVNALAELARRAGVPAGALNVVTTLANTPRVGEALTTLPAVKKVSFTGSTGVGKLLARQSSSTLKKLSLELGGNAPLIVFDDCPDLDAAVEGCVAAKFRGSGQTCVCANRIYVQSGVYELFAEKLAERVKRFKVGHAFDEGVTHGALIHSRAVDKVESHVKDAVSKGATVLVGGERLPELGPSFFQPTVLMGMNENMEIASNETFGPVAGLFKFETEEQVVAWANESEVGLAGYVFSSSIDRVTRLAEDLEVGMLGINTGIISDASTPFGGIKESGFGREGSKYGIEEYLVMKTVTLAALRP
ncbi:uncharacterized protein E0L32_007427 [Thyridium curvatum]|uniref:Succinate-semialdehyde dehydrogenase n=1 Tax=Thyridium curvatum TaxID=1093900 RepID=A0A507B3N2_9PEZI|nr:uncharacterized protein E0L32_007427 [Thyridium curvatum]TPX11929.1 hypothetical protein E0L32_007427 [Thyridium curvatum]